MKSDGRASSMRVLVRFKEISTRTELAERLGVNIKALDLVSLTSTSCAAKGCHLPGVLNNHKRCILCRQSWYPTEFNNETGEQKNSRNNNRGHGLYGPQFMRVYGDGKKNYQPWACCCDDPLCESIGYSHQGMMCLPTDPVQCAEAIKALGIQSSEVRSKQIIADNPSAYRVAPWHYSPRHRVMNKQTGNWILKKEATTYIDNEGSSFTFPPPNANVQGFIDHEIPSLEYSRGGRRDDVLPSWVRKLARLQEGWIMDSSEITTTNSNTTTPKLMMSGGIIMPMPSKPSHSHPSPEPVQQLEDMKEYVKVLQAKLNCALAEVEGLKASAAAAAMFSRAAALQQHQLEEFNQWLYKWNNHQQDLVRYWQGRYHSLHEEVSLREEFWEGAEAPTEEVVKKGESQSDAGLDKYEVKWQLRFQELCDFKEEHGHTDVPKEFTFKHSPPLGHWVGRMRTLYKKEKLKNNQIESLSQIGFKFVLSKTGDVKFSLVWDKSFQALKAFKDSNGHLEVPPGYKPQPDMPELDGWIIRQRKYFKDEKMPDYLKSKLMELGLNLEGRGRPYGLESEKSDTLWNSHYEALVAYQQLNGDADVPEKYSKDLDLGRWVKVQREKYSEGTLPEDRITSLNQLGFNFYGKKTKRVADPWKRRLSELQAYKDKTGNTNVPKKFVLNFGLGDFVYNQKMAYKHKNLSEEKIKSLEEMEFDWTLKPKKLDKKKQTNWEKRFDELVAYKSEHGNIDIPDKYSPNPLLAPWLKRQRKYHQVGQMKTDKFEMLKDLGFNFGSPKQIKQLWTSQYESLVEFKNEHGHLDVPRHYDRSPTLYQWMGTQKQTHKMGKMPEDRIALLNELDFDFAAKRRDRPETKGTRGGNKAFLDPEEWESLVGQLEIYKEKHGGNCDVPQKSGRLGSFVHYMRHIKSGKLSQERIDRLNELGFCWNVSEDRWNAKYEAVAKYKTEHGNFDIPASNHSLYNWTMYQRKLFLDNNLPRDHAETLGNIGFDFQMPEPKRARRKSDVKDPSQSWHLLFEDLMDFKNEHGNCDVPATYDPNQSLAKWVASQRMKYKRGRLKDEHEELLNDIGFKFGAKDPMEKLGVLKVPQVEPVSRESYLEDLWDKSYQELATYSNHFGHCNIPISYVANPSLGAWAFSQRMAFKKNKLSEDRVEKLSELGFSFGPK